MHIELTGYRLMAPLRAGPAAGVDARPADTGGDAGPTPGGPAHVWSGQRLADGRAVVLKLFHPADAPRATREADLAAAVEHPHVLPVLEVATGPQAVALVTPLARGGSLASLIAARRRLRWSEVLTVLIPLADALAAAHERDIVHGDLSAANVLFDDSGCPLLADLGAARAASECGVTVAVTPTDVAPEIARGADPDPAADLFSLGSVGLHCLSGCPAWPADDLQDVLIQSAAGQWPDPGELLGPPEVLAIVRRLLDPEPARRGSAARAAVELRAAGRPEPVELVAQQPDGTVTAPPPATVVRPDALRPPSTAAPRSSRRARAHRRRGAARRIASTRLRAVAGAPGDRLGRAAARRDEPAGRHHRQRLLTRVGATLRRDRGARHRPSDAGRTERRRWWPSAVAVAVVLLLGVGAVRAGLWWAGWGGTHPTAASQLPGSRASDSDRGTVASSPPDTDWLAVVTALDAARAAALTSRDPGLLDEVYTADASGRRADTKEISAMSDAGYHVTAATHHVRSATVVRVGDDGSVTLRVVESLPSYQVLGTDGAVVGTTAASHSVLMMGLRRTVNGYRIDRITRP